MMPHVSLRQLSGQFIVGDVLATIAAILAALQVEASTGSTAAAAVAASIAETVVWYTYLITVYRVTERLPVFSAMRNVIADFGLAELVDTLISRPFAMWLMPMLLGDPATGIIAGKILSDVVYSGVAVFRQIRRRMNR